MKSDKMWLIAILLIVIPIIGSAAYATFGHGAFKIMDGKDIDLNGQMLGNGYLINMSCSSNCSGFVNTSGTDLTLSGNLTAKNFGNESYSYLIYTDGTNYFAKNGSSGKIDYSGTDARDVIQATINQTGRTIYINNGFYSLNSLNIMYDDTKIIGNGGGSFASSGNTYFILNSNANIININGTVSNYIDSVTIENIKFLNSERKYEGRGINVQYGININVINSQFSKINGEAICMDSVYDTDITNSGFVSSGNDTRQNATIKYTATADKNTVVKLNNLIFEANYFQDIEYNATQQMSITNSFFESTTVAGKMLPLKGYINGSATSHYSVIKNNEFVYINDSATYIQNYGLYSEISGNMLYGASGSGTTNNIGIQTGHNANICCNTIKDVASSGISAGYDALIYSNYLYNTASGSTRYGIESLSGTIVTNNIIQGAGTSRGIYIGGNSITTNNRLQTLITGIATGGSNNTLNGNYFISVTTPTSIGATDISRDNYGVSPYNFGNKAAAPTAFGNGDTYFNSTKKSMCVYITSWVYIGNSTGIC